MYKANKISKRFLFLCESLINATEIKTAGHGIPGVPGVVVWPLRDRSNWFTLLLLPRQKSRGIK